MVSATLSPTETLPANSQKEAITMACFSVNDLDETEVAKELATSLAPSQISTRHEKGWSDLLRLLGGYVPMFQASRKAKRTAKANM